MCVGTWLHHISTTCGSCMHETTAATFMQTGLEKFTQAMCREEVMAHLGTQHNFDSDCGANAR